MLSCFTLFQILLLYFTLFYISIEAKSSLYHALMGSWSRYSCMWAAPADKISLKQHKLLCMLLQLHLHVHLDNQT